MKMNDPASALDLDLGELSDTELYQQIEALRKARLSDVERSRRSVAAKTVTKISGSKAGIRLMSPEQQIEKQLETLIKAAGMEDTVTPEMREKLKKKLLAGATKAK